MLNGKIYMIILKYKPSPGLTRSTKLKKRKFPRLTRDPELQEAYSDSIRGSTK